MQPQALNSTQAATVALPAMSLLDRIAEQKAETATRYMPTLSVEQFSERETMLRQLKEMLVGPTPDHPEGVDYGIIPGTKKPTLLKPGAEKICAFFGYAPDYEILPGSIEDWDGAKFGEPLFYYHVRCTLAKDGAAVGQGTGSCSSWESKYRYRMASRKCPACGVAAMIKGREEYGGGWVCFEKKGGCKAKYKDGDAAIEGQEVGRVANPDIADIINTVQKMGDKRAYIAACLSATGASQYFSQDLEDVDPAALGIDTGGNPVGTQAAANAVRDRKLAEAKRTEPAAQKKQQAPAAAKPAPAPAQAPAPAPAAAPAAPQAAPQQESVPPAVAAMWARMTDLRGILGEFGQMKKDIEELTGGNIAYYEILGKHGMAHANEVRKIGMKQTRVCAREMFEWLAKVGEQLAEPAPAASVDDKEDWIPEIIGDQGRSAA